VAAWLLFRQRVADWERPCTQSTGSKVGYHWRTTPQSTDGAKGCVQGGVTPRIPQAVFPERIALPARQIPTSQYPQAMHETPFVYNITTRVKHSQLSIRRKINTLDFNPTLFFFFSHFCFVFQYAKSKRRNYSKKKINS
jgi:hypothetical protein